MPDVNDSVPAPGRHAMFGASVHAADEAANGPARLVTAEMSGDASEAPLVKKRLRPKCSDADDVA